MALAFFLGMCTFIAVSKKVETELIGTEVDLSISETRSIGVYILGEAYKPAYPKIDEDIKKYRLQLKEAKILRKNLEQQNVQNAEKVKLTDQLDMCVCRIDSILKNLSEDLSDKGFRKEPKESTLQHISRYINKK